jgi:hypothetical protein
MQLFAVGPSRRTLRQGGRIVLADERHEQSSCRSIRLSTGKKQAGKNEQSLPFFAGQGKAGLVSLKPFSSLGGRKRSARGIIQMQVTARRKHFLRSSDPESGHWSEPSGEQCHKPQFSSQRLAESSLTPKNVQDAFMRTGHGNWARIAHVEGLSRDAVALNRSRDCDATVWIYS